MKRRILSLVLCVIVLSTAFTGACASLKFSDVPDDFWASNDIYTLVEEGIINGYTDGTFRPDANVTRAEFAKLVGPGIVENKQDFKDVPKRFWGYSYIMKSNIDAGNLLFFPDEYMKRGDICEILYDRHGNNLKITFPAAIKTSSFDKNAVAWAYSTGLMIGNNGVDLRLSDFVTRAEAVTLIQRAKKVDNTKLKTLYDNVDDRVLEYLFNSVDAFGVKYNEKANIKLGELAQAVVNFAYSHVPSTSVFSGKADFEADYAKAFALLCNKVWGDDKCTKEFAEQNANMQQTLSALMFGYMSFTKNNSAMLSSTDLYKDFEDNGTNMQKLFVGTAKANGVVIKGNNMNAKKIATHKDIAIMLLQINAISGLECSYSNKFRDESLSTDVIEISDYAKDNYMIFLDSVPKKVYETEMVGNSTTCKEITRFIRGFKSVFTYVTKNLQEKLNAKGYNTEIIFYPSMVAESNSGGYIVRFKINANEDIQLAEIIANGAGDRLLKSSRSYFVDVDTKANISDMLNGISDMEIVNFIEA